jgi:hypothetical protein
MGGADQTVNQYAQSAAQSAAGAAGNAFASLIQAFGGATEPVFSTIAPAYNRMLAIAVLLAGAFAAMALIERVLGGPRGAGWEVVLRTAAAVAAATVGLSVVQYGAHYASLLASAWNTSALDVGNRFHALYASSMSAGHALGSTVGLLLVSLLMFFLILLVFVELMLRAALILVTTTFIPLVAVMAIWPRFSSAAAHLADFLVALLLSKFVVVTAIFVCFSMAVNGASADSGMVIAIVALLIALVSPVILLQGIRHAQASTGTLARGWVGSGAKGAAASAAFVNTRSARFLGAPASAKLGGAGKSLLRKASGVMKARQAAKATGAPEVLK